eukprot:gene14541-63775_t
MLADIFSRLPAEVAAADPGSRVAAAAALPSLLVALLRSLPPADGASAAEGVVRGTHNAARSWVTAVSRSQLGRRDIGVADAPLAE